MFRKLWSYLLPSALGIACGFVINQYIASAALVPTGSMEPTLPAPCYIIVNKMSTEVSHLSRGEVVLFRFPDNTTRIFVKRIIGMPGDTVRVTKNHVYINGKLMDEPYIHQPNGKGLGTYHVPAGHYFMMGDNREVSDDSRFWVHKYVPHSAIIGEASLVVFPLSEISVVRQ